MKKNPIRPLLIASAAGAAFCGGLSTQAIADQPFMHEALVQLAEARATLAAGAMDKGGHRVRAIALIDRAEAEVRAGIGYERRH